MMFIVFLILTIPLCQNIYEYHISKTPSHVILSQNPTIFSNNEALFCNFLSSTVHRCKNFESKGIFTKNPSFSITKILLFYSSQFNGQKLPNFYSLDPVPLYESIKSFPEKFSIPLNFEFNNNKDDDREDFVKNVDNNINSFNLTGLISSVNTFSQPDAAYSGITFGFFNAGEISEDDFVKFDAFDSKTLVIIAVKSKKSKTEIINGIARLYSDDVCEFFESKVRCKTPITPNIEARLCNLNLADDMVYDSVFCEKKTFSSVQTRSDASKNPHNLNTYAEYNSDYPVVFTMCLGIAILVIVVSIVLFMLLGKIDISQSILQRDTITKLKNE